MTTTVLHTDHLTADPESGTAATTPTARGGSRLRRVVSGLLAALVVPLIAMVASATPAAASAYNYDFDAYCNSNHTITAWAPDLTHDDSSWVVVWAPVLYRWNGSTWVKFLAGATQTEVGGSWIVQEVWFSKLPTGYYQVRDTYSWIHNGAKTGAYAVLAPVTHKLDGVSYYYGASLPTLRYSTASYCYES